MPRDNFKQESAVKTAIAGQSATEKHQANKGYSQYLIIVQTSYQELLVSINVLISARKLLQNQHIIQQSAV